MNPRIALIHATKVAMQPIEEAFIRLWPEAGRMNLLEDSLSADLASSKAITPDLTRRFVALAEYAKAAGANGILYTCSAFGPSIEAARDAVGIPTLKPNEAMYAEALKLGKRIGLITTFAPAAAPMQDELFAMAAEQHKDIELRAVCAPEALSALQAGDAEKHDQLVAEAALSLQGCEVIMLGQFSMARALPAMEALTSVPVLASPECAVRMLQGLVKG
ncbi:aspartate/glutamate racemase family protein [Noviherbaspirillum aerium]|uniref:aspartate/glutamate racemase family protein n=1 Tax=Noviherbaspirillum aerium TaxID=2588497 RepID=UPI00124C6150|nr:aspartate/glutamate racemase family protein [Noviherbaspirillum aerium]